MRGILTKACCLTVAALFSAVPAFALGGAEVKDARVWAGPDYTRVVFDLSGPISYKLSQQGDQVSIDLPGGHIAGTLDAHAQGQLKQLLHSDQAGSLRLTAVAPNSQPKSFVLGPSGSAGYRLVLDLYPGKGAPADTPVVASVPAVADKPAAVAAPVSLPGKHDDKLTDATNDDAAPPASDAPVVNPVSKWNRKGVSTRQAAILMNGQRQVIVAVDAGHGGKDQGAHGPDGLLEKDVTLAVARDLAAQINRQPGMKAILTRDSDVFIPLKQRYEIARQNQADLFVAIHADSFSSSDARGSSVWVLSPRGKSSVAAQMLADRENSSDLIGGVSLAAENDSLASVLLDMQQGWAVQASETVAQNVLSALSSLGPTHRGYVEHANFVVLRSPDVPSILVETAFISNPVEERKLRDPDHQQKLASAIMDGVRGYFTADPPQGTWFAAEAARRKGYDVGGGSQLASSKGADTHRVADGETLRSIAKQYGVSVDALKNANGINSDSVRVGTTLSIPGG